MDSSLGMEFDYKSVNLERLFRENDELEILKTLQHMHINAYKLELDIKSLVTDELDSILLCVTTVLDMCNIIRSLRDNINGIKNISTDDLNDVQGLNICGRPLDKALDNVGFWEYRMEGNKGKSTDIQTGISPPEESSFTSLHEDLGSLTGVSTDFHHTLRSSGLVGVLERVPELNESMRKLQRISMENYRLLKRNKVLESYELLCAKTPTLLRAVNKNVPAKSDVVKTFRFHINKLRNHCLNLLKVVDIKLLMDVLLVLLLLDKDGVVSIINKRGDALNVLRSKFVMKSPCNIKTIILYHYGNALIAHITNIFEGDKRIELCSLLPLKPQEVVNVIDASPVEFSTANESSTFLNSADLSTVAFEILNEDLMEYDLFELSLVYVELLDYVSKVSTEVKQLGCLIFKCIGINAKVDEITEEFLSNSSKIFHKICQLKVTGAIDNLRYLFTELINSQAIEKSNVMPWSNGELDFILSKLLGINSELKGLNALLENEEHKDFIHEKLLILLNEITEHISLEFKNPPRNLTLQNNLIYLIIALEQLPKIVHEDLNLIFVDLAKKLLDNATNNVEELLKSANDCTELINDKNSPAKRSEPFRESSNKNDGEKEDPSDSPVDIQSPTADNNPHFHVEASETQSGWKGDDSDTISGVVSDVGGPSVEEDTSITLLSSQAPFNYRWYTLWILYEASRIKSRLRLLNSFKDCKFTLVLDQISYENSFDLYIRMGLNDIKRLEVS